MLVVSGVADLINLLDQKRAADYTLGFVPTMGALHEGHKSLIQQARNENDLVVVSVFVNPTQFNDPADLLKYPQTPAADRELCENAGADILFAPSRSEMYPEGEQGSAKFDLGPLETILEGAFRKGHFQGVATIVEKLFRIINPDRAYFGEKDFQQLAVIKRLVRSAGLQVEIIACPTIREKDGLAMSSRNVRLSPQERILARAIPEALFSLKRNLQHKPLTTALEGVKSELLANKGIELEYLSVVDADTFENMVDSEPGKNLRALIAARIGQVRLIDNIPL